MKPFWRMAVIVAGVEEVLDHPLAVPPTPPARLASRGLLVDVEVADRDRTPGTDLGQGAGHHLGVLARPPRAGRSTGARPPSATAAADAARPGGATPRGPSTRTPRRLPHSQRLRAARSYAPSRAKKTISWLRVRTFTESSCTVPSRSSTLRKWRLSTRPVGRRSVNPWAASATRRASRRLISEMSELATAGATMPGDAIRLTFGRGTRFSSVSESRRREAPDGLPRGGRLRPV